MKFSFFNYLLGAASLASSSPPILLAATSLRGPSSSGAHLSDSIHNRMLLEDEEGTFLIAAKAAEEGTGGGEEEIYSVELDGGYTYEITNANSAWMNGKAKELKSGASRFKIPRGASISNGVIDFKGGQPEDIPGKAGDRKLTEPETTEEQERNLATIRRQLQARTLGERTVLAVKVIASNSAYSYSKSQLSNYVFGTSGDTFNLKSQYTACSHGALNFTIAEPGGRQGTSTSIADGVTEITVSTSTQQGDSVMRNAITAEINSQFGVSRPDQIADHVMYCLPPNTMNGIAYAYINSWNSVYSNEWCNYPSGQMHELGHNLDFAHSSENGEYEDQTGLMGYSYSDNHGPKMCFNAAKSFQAKWYTAGQVIVDAGETFNGKLYGIADYDGSRTVLIKVNDPGSSTDYYINYNRKIGINSGTREAGNLVTIQSAGAEGNSYSYSKLVGKLGAQDTHVIRNVGGGGNKITVEVTSINNNVSPGYAQVRIYDNSGGDDGGGGCPVCGNGLTCCAPSQCESSGKPSSRACV